MRQLITTGFALLLPVLWQAAHPCHAAPTVKTTPHLIPLHFVSDLPGGPVVPRIALKANFVTYPDTPSYKQFLDAPADSPERAVVGYIRALSDGHETPAPETLNTAKAFYAEDERKESADILTKLIKSHHYGIERQADIRLWHRYDAGPLSIITLAYISPERKYGIRVQPFVSLYLRKIGASYFLTSYATGRRKQDRSTFSQVIDLSESLLVWRPNLAEVAQPDYPYHFPLNSVLPASTPLELKSAANSAEIAFTGRASDVLVDQSMVPADATQALVKRAVQAQRTGNRKEFLSLYMDSDRKDLIEGVPEGIPDTELAFIFDYAVRLVFTIDCGIENLVFLQVDSKEETTIKPLLVLVVWKKSPKDYRLSDPNSFSSDETTLIGNLQSLFDGPEFGDYLKDQVEVAR